MKKLIEEYQIKLDKLMAIYKVKHIHEIENLADRVGAIIMAGIIVDLNKALLEDK